MEDWSEGGRSGSLRSRLTLRMSRSKEGVREEEECCEGQE